MMYDTANAGLGGIPGKARNLEEFQEYLHSQQIETMENICCYQQNKQKVLVNIQFFLWGASSSSLMLVYASSQYQY